MTRQNKKMSNSFEASTKFLTNIDDAEKVKKLNLSRDDNYALSSHSSEDSGTSESSS